MARLLEKRRVATVRGDAQLTGDELLQDYLDHLVAPLIGIVPFPERQNFRIEVSIHLEGHIRENVCHGLEIREASEAALIEFGEPWLVGKSFLHEWLQGAPTRPPAPLVRKATVIAFAFFGALSVADLILLETQAFTGPRAYMLPMVALLAFFAPFVAGCLTGMLAPDQAERGVRNAVVLLAIHSLVVGLLMIPSYQVIGLSVWQLLFWLPAGRVSAAATASCLRHYWRQRYWHIAQVADRGLSAKPSRSNE